VMVVRGRYGSLQTREGPVANITVLSPPVTELVRKKKPHRLPRGPSYGIPPKRKKPHCKFFRRGRGSSYTAGGALSRFPDDRLLACFGNQRRMGSRGLADNISLITAELRKRKKEMRSQEDFVRTQGKRKRTSPRRRGPRVLNSTEGGKKKRPPLLPPFRHHEWRRGTREGPRVEQGGGHVLEELHLFLQEFRGKGGKKKGPGVAAPRPHPKRETKQLG